MPGAHPRVESATARLIDMANGSRQNSRPMDPFSANYFNGYNAFDHGTTTGVSTVSSDRSETTSAAYNTSPLSYYNAHRASDPGCFTRPSLPAEDSLDLSRFDLLARSAVNTLHVQDVIKPAHNTPWVGPQQRRVQREPYQRPPLLRSPYAKSEPLLRPDGYSDAADSGYVSQWPGLHSATNNYSMNIHELEQDYQPLADVVSPTGGADNRSTVSDGRLMSDLKQRKNKRALTQCPQCGRQPRNLSDSKKHALTHTKPYRCTESDCTRKDGFATENDLQRHRKSVHNLLPTVGSPAGYICAACVPEADATPKFWPRRDNFKAHIKRKHPNHHEATLIEASRRRLRPGDDHASQPDTESVTAGMRSARQSQVDPNEIVFQSARPSDARLGSSVSSDHNEIFGLDSGITSPSEQALVGMQGHTVDQYGNNTARGSNEYGSRQIDSYNFEPAETDHHGNHPTRFLTVLSEAANNMDYTGSPLFVSGPRRPRKYPPEYGQQNVTYTPDSSQGQYPCQHPDCNKAATHEYDFTYGQRLSSIS